MIEYNAFDIQINPFTESPSPDPPDFIPLETSKRFILRQLPIVIDQPVL